MLASRPDVRPLDTHKGAAGRVLVCAGSRWMPGAGLLAATGALRGGAGLVTLANRSDVVLDMAVRVRPELLLWHWDDDLNRGDIGDAFEERRIDAVVVGPGIAVNKRSEAMLGLVLSTWEGPLVLDAGALSLIAADKSLLAFVQQRGRASGALPAIVTPHPGEAARLLRREIASDEDGRRADAIALARHLSAIVCLKGPGTLVVDPSGERVWRNPSGNPGMATGGTGDVLAGLLGALIASAREANPLWSLAKTGVYWHGLAGDRAARRLGERAMLASDLADELGHAEMEGPWA